MNSFAFLLALGAVPADDVPRPPEPEPVRSQELEAAIDRGVAHLLSTQDEDGSWGSSRWTGGVDQDPVPGAFHSFDVAVTATEGQEREGKAGLKVWSVGVGGAMKGSTASETVSRVQFAVRVVAPTTWVAARSP